MLVVLLLAQSDIWTCKGYTAENGNLPVALCGCETWSSVILREERMLRVFECWVLWRVFGVKKEEMTEG